MVFLNGNLKSVLQHLSNIPAILVEGEDITTVLNACNTEVVPVLGCKYFIREIIWASAWLSVFWPVVPEDGHHHVSCRIQVQWGTEQLMDVFMNYGTTNVFIYKIQMLHWKCRNNRSNTLNPTHQYCFQMFLRLINVLTFLAFFTFS